MANPTRYADLTERELGEEVLRLRGTFDSASAGNKVELLAELGRRHLLMADVVRAAREA